MKVGCREREDIRQQHLAATDECQGLQQAYHEAEESVVDLRRQQQGVEEESSVCSPSLTEIDRSVFRQSEELAAVDSHLRALQGVLREDVGMGGAATKNRRHLKPLPGFATPLPSGWLCLPDGIVLWKQFWASGSGDGSSMVHQRVRGG